MVRRSVIVAALVCLLATPALGDDIVAKKQAVDSQIANLQGKLTTTKQSETTLRGRIANLSDQIGSLETQVGGVSQQLSSLEQDLSLRRQRLADLTALYRIHIHQLHTLKLQYTNDIVRLDKRLVAIYESGTPSTIDFVLGSSSITDVLNKVDLVNRIGLEDRQIADEVKHQKLLMKASVAHTKALRLSVLGDERALAARTEQVQQTKDTLVGAQNQLAASKDQQSAALSHLSSEEQTIVEEMQQEQAVSNQLAAQIRAAQASEAGGQTATPSSAGLIWPVNGPVTSPFGPRCLFGVCGFHPGIDIGVPIGTPIHAAASGTVIYCGWETGYGNFVVIDNGNNLSTGYAHQSRIAVTCGEHVAQGDVIGYSGCTGTCYGPHVHFEVRINGTPVDPMGYLP